MTSYEFERALVYIAEQIIKTFGKDVGVQEPKQEPVERDLEKTRSTGESLIKDEKALEGERPIKEQLLSLGFRMADAEDDIATLKERIAGLCGESE